MKKFKQGVTLVEIMVVVTIIAILTGVVISDFPKIKLRLNLSRIAHMIAQDIKTAQSLSGSGREVEVDGSAVSLRGYGIFIDTNVLGGNKRYVIYGDVNGDYKYSPGTDYVEKEVDLSSQDLGIMISEIRNAPGKISINFSPPNFNTTISNLLSGKNSIDIVVSIEKDPSVYRIISVNKAGLIEIK